MYVTSKSTTVAASMDGMMARLILSREIPAIPLLTKRQTPRGRRTGVRMMSEVVFQPFVRKKISYTSFACCSPVLPKRRSRRWKSARASINWASRKSGQYIGLT